MRSQASIEAFAYADAVCARLPRALQEAMEARDIRAYGLEQKCGVSRDMLGDVLGGTTVPTFHWGARAAHGLGMKLWEFIREVEEGKKAASGPEGGGASEMSD